MRKDQSRQPLRCANPECGRALAAAERRAVEPGIFIPVGTPEGKIHRVYSLEPLGTVQCSSCGHYTENLHVRYRPHAEAGDRKP
jgi:hypothetical protein